MQPGTANSAMVAKLEHWLFFDKPVSVLPLPLFSALKNKTTCSPIQHEDKETRQPKQEKQNQTQKTHTQVSQGTLGSFSAAITRGQAGSSTRTHRDVLCNMHTRSKCCFFQEELTSCFRELQIYFFFKGLLKVHFPGAEKPEVATVPEV